MDYLFSKAFPVRKGFFLLTPSRNCGIETQRRGEEVGCKVMRNFSGYSNVAWGFGLGLCLTLCVVIAQEDAALDTVDKRAVTPLCPMLDTIEGVWSERKMVQYLEPLVKPPTFAHSDQPDPKAAMDFMQRKIQSLGCEAYARVHYGKKNLAINTGGHHCVIYRWEDSDLLDLA